MSAVVNTQHDRKTSLKIGEDLCRRRKPQEALPYLMKAMEDPNNLDAIVQMAFLMPTMQMGVKLLEEGEGRGAYHVIFGCTQLEHAY